MTEAVLALVKAQGRAHSAGELANELAHVWVAASDAESCDILHRDSGESLILQASTIFPEMIGRVRLGKGIGLSGQCLQNNEAIFISQGASKDPRFARYPNTAGHDFEAEAVLPLGLEGHPPFGVVLIRKAAVWEFTPEVIDDLTVLAEASSAILHGFDLAYSAGSKNSRLGALSEVSRTIAQSPYLEEILQLLVNLTAQQFNYRVCTVRLLDENRNELVLRATQAPAKAYQRKRAIKLGESIAGRAIAENRPVIVRDVQVDEDYIGHDLAVEQGLRSMICVPLTVQEKPIGVLSCYTSEVRNFTSDEIKALETLAKQAAISIEHAKMQVRTTLMQEMHHRVKNNLQQVASLLRLQMRYSQFKSLDEALNDCLNRILAISSVHDLLSREDLDHVGVKSIAESLVHHQQGSFTLPDTTIRWEIRGGDVKLNMTQATQLALVLNELMLNAVEHGFKVAKTGDIHITIEENDDEVSIWVANSGDPLPEDFDPTVTTSLGLRIVDSLARALGGRYKMSNVMGWTVAEVKFPRATGE